MRKASLATAPANSPRRSAIPAPSAIASRSPTTVRNARVFLAAQELHGSFAEYIWGFVNGTPRQHAWKNTQQVPVTTAQSDAMSKALKQWGFTFVGSTLCYAYMQAVGMVNAHNADCFRWRE